MEKILLEEINRNRKLMGLSLITEQGLAWLDNLINKGVQRFVSLDNIISKLGLSGENKILKDADIDKIIDELPETIDDKAKNQIRSALKKDANLKASLANQNDDFLLKLRNSKDTTNIGGFSKVVEITPEQVSSTVRGVMNKFLDDPLSNISKSFDNLDNSITTPIKKYISSKGNTKLRSADEIYDIADALIQRNLNKRIKDGMSNELANEIFNRFKTKIRTDSKLKKELDELISSNRVSNLPKRTTSIDNFNSIVEVPDDLIAASSWIDNTSPGPVRNGGDIPSGPVRDGEVPTTIDEVDDYLETIDPPGSDGPPVIDLFPGGVPNPTFFNNFWFKFCKLGFCEVLIDFVRSLGKTPADFADDMIFTQARIADLVDRLGRIKPGDAGYKDLKFELDGWVNRLKSNTKMVSTPQTGFLSQWENVKNNIITTLGPEHRALANEIIQHCENRAVTSGNETIGEFIQLLNQKSSGLDLPMLADLRKIATPEYWANWKKTSVVKYANEVKDFYKKTSKVGGWVGGGVASLLKILGDFIGALLLRTGNFLLFGTFRYYKNLLKRLRVGSFTNTEGLRRYVLLYVELTLIANVVGPFIEYAEDLIKTWLEIEGIMETDEIKKTPKERIYENFLERIPGFGNEFEWNPFFNVPGGVIDPILQINNIEPMGEILGFKPAPLPEALTLGVIKILQNINWLSNQNRAKDVNETRRRELESEFEEQTNQFIDQINEQSIREYEANKDQVEKRNGKENIIKTITNYSDPKFLLYYEDFDLLSADEVQKLRESLVFQPGISPETKNSILNRERNKKRTVRDKDGKVIGFYYPKESINKFVPNDLGEKDGLKPSPTVPKDAKVEYPDVDSMLSDLNNNNGYWVLKGSDGKFYLLKPNESGFMYYLTPSIDEIEKNPNVKVTQNDLQKFVDKL